jgi:hypothetical protein
MAEFRIRRTDVFMKPGNYLAVFDALVVAQANGSPDLVYLDGWTETLSIALYRSHPIFHRWAMAVGLIPRDNVAAAFPMYLKGQALKDYVLEKLPSEMTAADRKKLIGGSGVEDPGDALFRR